MIQGEFFVKGVPGRRGIISEGGKGQARYQN